LKGVERMEDDPKDVFTEFMSKLRALESWADREKIRMFEPILGESLCEEVLEKIEGVIAVLEKIKERVSFYEGEIAEHLEAIDENLRKLIETEEYRFIISNEGVKRLREIRDKLDSFRLFHFRYDLRREKVEVKVDG